MTIYFWFIPVQIASFSAITTKSMILCSNGLWSVHIHIICGLFKTKRKKQIVWIELEQIVLFWNINPIAAFLSIDQMIVNLYPFESNVLSV